MNRILYFFGKLLASNLDYLAVKIIYLPAMLWNSKQSSQGYKRLQQFAFVKQGFECCCCIFSRSVNSNVIPNMIQMQETQI